MIFPDIEDISQWFSILFIFISPEDASAFNLFALSSVIFPDAVFIVASSLIFPTSISPDDASADNLLKSPAFILPELAFKVTSFPLPIKISPD